MALQRTDRMTDPQKMAKDPNIPVITARLFELILQMPVIDRQNLLRNLEEEQKRSKRKAPREKYFKDIDFATTDRAFRGFIYDISASGVMIKSSETVSLGQEVTLAFEPPHAEKHLKIKGKIVRIIPNGGFGVEFYKIIDSLTRE